MEKSVLYITRPSSHENCYIFSSEKVQVTTCAWYVDVCNGNSQTIRLYFCECVLGTFLCPICLSNCLGEKLPSHKIWTGSLFDRLNIRVCLSSHSEKGEQLKRVNLCRISIRFGLVRFCFLIKQINTFVFYYYKIFQAPNDFPTENLWLIF